MSTLWTEYDGAFFGDATFYSIGCDANGKPNPGETPAYAYESHAESSTVAQAMWGASVEYRTIERCTDGKDWAISKAYGDRNLGLTWAVECVRLDWANVQTGEFFDGTHLLKPGPTGAPFCPNDVPDSGERMGRTWGWIWTDAKQTGVPRRDHTFFYQVNLGYGFTVLNSCWTGNGSNSVLAVIMHEAWWDSIGGWARGKGTALPWVNGAVADPGDVTYTGWQAWGRGRGALWAYRYPEYNTAVVYFTAKAQPVVIPPPVITPPPVDPPPIEVPPMTTFTGGSPQITFSNDDLYRLGHAINGATAPGTTPPGPTATPPPGGGGGTWPIPGYVCYDLPWISTTSATRLIVNMNCDQEACIRFVPQATTKNGWIALVEYNAPRYNRIAVISTIPGDFNAQPGTPPYKAGSSINFDYSTSGAQPFVVDLSPGYTYYMNLKTTNGTPGAPATMSLDLYVPT